MRLSLHLLNGSLVVQLQQQLSACKKKKKITMSFATALHFLLYKIKMIINF